MITRICGFCKKEFYTHQCLVKQGAGKHCSRECYANNKKQKVESRFWGRVNKTETCWLWLGKLNKLTGYGRIRHNGKDVGVHRFSYLIANGFIDDNLEIDHLCRVRHCVNPSHLELVTHKENDMRGVAPSITAHNTSICMKGLHRMEGTNIKVTKGRRGIPGKTCRLCSNERNKEYYKRKEADPAYRERRRKYMRDWKAKKRDGA